MVGLEERDVHDPLGVSAGIGLPQCLRAYFLRDYYISVIFCLIC